MSVIPLMGGYPELLLPVTEIHERRTPLNWEDEPRRSCEDHNGLTW